MYNHAFALDAKTPPFRWFEKLVQNQASGYCRLFLHAVKRAVVSDGGACPTQLALAPPPHNHPFQ